MAESADFKYALKIGLTSLGYSVNTEKHFGSGMADVYAKKNGQCFLAEVNYTRNPNWFEVRVKKEEN